MSTTTAEFTTVTPTTGLQRIGRVVRLHFANPWTTIWMPWLILGGIFVLNLSIWYIIFAAADDVDRAGVSRGLQYSGAMFWIFVYMMVVAVQAINITFPFALGYGVTRRDYYLGTSLDFVILSAIYTAGLTILSILEEATGGWGFGGRLFTAVYFGGDWVQRMYVFFVAFLFFFFVGAAFAAVFVRWKATGLTISLIGLAFVVVALLGIVVFTDSAGAIASFFAGAGLVGSASLSLVITALAGILGYLVLRRATPRS